MERDTLDKLSRRQLFGYALGAVPAGLLAFIFSLKYIEYFFDDLKLLPMYFIAGQVIYMIINAINDPLLGQLSDKTNREKWGSRRLIYIKYGGPIWALTFVLLWFPWSLDNQFIIFLHYTITICLFDTMLTLVILVWMALLPEMTASTDERNKANFLALLFGAMAVIPMFIVLGTLKTLSDSFRLFMIFIAIISSVLLIIVSYTCEERPEFQKDEVFPIWKSIKETIKLKSFRWFMLYNFCGVFLGSLLLSYIFVYILVLGGSTEALFGFFLIYVIIGYGANIVCMKLQPKWGMRKVILRFGILRVIGTFGIFFLMLVPALESLIWIGFIWIMFFGGYSVYTTGGLMYLSVDEDELNTGTRREGIFLGVNALFTKPAGSLGPILATVVLVSFGYQQGSDVQPDSAFLGIKILLLIVPAIVTAISLIFIYYYPIHGEKLEEMKAKLEILHIEKRKRIEK